MLQTDLSTELPPVDINAAFGVVERKLNTLVTEHPNQIPTYTSGGRWHFAADAWAPVWTSGFLAGLLWAVADHTKNAAWRQQAEHYCLLFEERKHDTGTHDIGFLFTPSWERWYRIEPSERIRDVIIAAGRSLATNFNENGRYLRTWVDAGSSFIDIMMNVGILYKAAELSGDDSIPRSQRTGS